MVTLHGIPEPRHLDATLLPCTDRLPRGICQLPLCTGSRASSPSDEKILGGKEFKGSRVLGF